MRSKVWLDITIERKIKLGAVLLKTKKNEIKIENALNGLIEGINF